MMLSNRIRAIFWLMAGVFTFSLQDIVIKTVSGSYPVHQVIVVRCLAALPFILFLVHRAGGIKTLMSPRRGALILRGVMLLTSYTSYFLAFPVMKLADIIALYATVPLFVTALAGPVLGEKISLVRWGAILIGFMGALVMVKPGSGVFEFASLLPIVAAIAYASAQVVARRIGLNDSAAVMSFYQNLLYLCAAGAHAQRLLAALRDEVERFVSQASVGDELVVHALGHQHPGGGGAVLAGVEVAGDGEPFAAKPEKQVPELVRAERDAAEDMPRLRVAQRADGLPDEHRKQHGPPAPVAAGGPRVDRVACLGGRAHVTESGRPRAAPPPGAWRRRACAA